MDFLRLILLLPVVLMIFNVIIIVHELGHFLAARWRGLYVDRFAVWFGKPLFKKKIGGVTYILGRIPAGGYVSVPQLANMEAVEGRVDIDPEILKNLGNAKPLDKIIVALAGPVFSLGLAFVFACIVFLVGMPTSKSNSTTEIGYVEPGSPADEAGIQVGDRVISVDGNEVRQFVSSDRSSIMWNVIDSRGETIDVVVERNGAQQTFNIRPAIEETKFYQRDKIKAIGVYPTDTILIGQTMKDSPAEVVGLKAGDELVAIDGTPIKSMATASDYIRANGTKPLNLEIIRRDSPTSPKPGERLNFTVTPEQPISGQETPSPMLGVVWAEPRFDGLSHPNPFTQVKESAMMVVNTIKALTNKYSGVKIEHLSGPVGIVDAYYNMLTLHEGWRLVLWFSVVLNVNLAIMNMLPFPVLDGGHITMSLLEIITRKPINVRVLEVLQMGFALVLISFMLFVTFYDVQELAPQGEPKPIIFAPKDAQGNPLPAPATP